MLRFAKSVAAASLIVLPAISFAARDGQFLDTAELKCISDGMEVATSQNGGLGLTPSPKFLALVGFGMQRFQKDTNGNAGLDRETYQQKVIEFIQANGYCLAEAVDGAGQPTKRDGYGGIKGSDQKEPDRLALIVLGTGTKRVNDNLSQNQFTTKEIDQTVKLLGFKDIDQIKAIFQNDNFSGQTPAQRQEFFQKAIADNGRYSDGLKECFNQMKNMEKLSPVYNHNGKRSPQSIKVCETLADECGLPDKKFCSLSVQINRKSVGGQPVKTAPAKTGPSIYDGVGGSGGAQ
ncbi:MAG: hypothetical protein JSU04_12530 [Bdellovibrionales bacterium]|nr:hypothetical protein [Bdellovibrionales bacterium]